jgi:hypothetical protein
MFVLVDDAVKPLQAVQLARRNGDVFNLKGTAAAQHAVLDLSSISTGDGKSSIA